MSRAATTTSRRTPVPPVLVGITLVVVVLAGDALWLLVPWTAAPAGDVDRTAGLEPALVADAQQLAARLRLPALLALLATTATAVLLVVPAPGRSLLARLRRRVPGLPLQVLLTGLIVLVAVGLVRVPFAVWQERIRVAEGLSVRGADVFARDLATAWVLRSVPTLVAVLVVVLLAAWLPRWWPAVVAAAAALFVVVASLLYPVLVEPRFASFEELPDGELRSEVLRLAAVAGAPVQDVLVSDASTRTTTLNAYVSGLGPTRRLVLQDTLVTRFDDDEVRAVAAHEVAHAAAGDMVRGTVLGALGTAAVVLLLGCLAVARTARGGSPVGQASAAGPVVLVLLVVPLLGMPAESLVSRQVERAADARAVETTGEPAAYADMIRTLTLANRSDPAPPGWVVWWFGTHPTPAERVAVAEALAAEDGDG